MTTQEIAYRELACAIALAEGAGELWDHLDGWCQQFYLQDARAILARHSEIAARETASEEKQEKGADAGEMKRRKAASRIRPVPPWQLQPKLSPVSARRSAQKSRPSAKSKIITGH
ncbi:MAG TPA: hypothetical protein VGF97_15820 [Rhizomicrobium sp.]|jgi:hypothetical protein